MAIYSYVRVSSKGQVEGDGLERQRRVIEQYARLHSLDVRDEGSDPGESGRKDCLSRPGFAALLKQAVAGDTILVERPDRLARRVLPMEIILDTCRQIGIKVVAVDNNIDLTADEYDDPTATLIRQILDALAQWDRTMIENKLRVARDRKSREAGYRVEGQHGYNGRSVGLLVEISRLRRLGHTWQQIATNFNGRKVPTCRGGRWSGGTVYKLYRRHAA